jgi:hypothetical protein
VTPVTAARRVSKARAITFAPCAGGDGLMRSCIGVLLSSGPSPRAWRRGGRRLHLPPTNTHRRYGGVQQRRAERVRHASHGAGAADIGGPGIMPRSSLTGQVSAIITGRSLRLPAAPLKITAGARLTVLRGQRHDRTWGCAARGGRPAALGPDPGPGGAGAGCGFTGCGPAAHTAKPPYGGRALPPCSGGRQMTAAAAHMSGSREDEHVTSLRCGGQAPVSAGW